MSASDRHINDASDSTMTDLEMKKEKKPGPLDFLLKSDTFKPLHKLLNGGSFCDPFQPSLEPSSNKNALSPVGVHDLSAQDRELIFGENNIVETSADNKNVEVKDVIDGSESTATPPAVNPKTESWRSMFPTDSKGDITKQEAFAPVKQEPSEADASPGKLQTEPEPLPLRTRARSLSSEGGEITLSEAHTPKGAPKSPTSTVFNESKISRADDAVIARSPIWQIFKFFIIWSVALLAGLFLHPDTGYDGEWLVEQSEKTQKSLLSQVQQCQSFANGNQATDCVLERFRSAVKDGTVKCTAYANGGSDTACFVEDGVQQLVERTGWLKDALHGGIAAFQAEAYRCDSFLSGDRETGSTLEAAYATFEQYRVLSIQMLRHVQSQVIQEYNACSAFLHDDVSGTTCSLQKISDTLKEQHALAKAKLSELQDGVDKEYKTCQAFWKDGKTNTGCTLEYAQHGLMTYKSLAENKLQQASSSVGEQQVRCHAYSEGKTSTGCVLEEAAQVLNSRATEWQAVLQFEAVECQKYYLGGQTGTGCSLERLYMQITSAQEGTLEANDDAMESLVDKASPVEAPDLLANDDAVANPGQPEPFQVDTDEETSKLDESKLLSSSKTLDEERKKFAETYFDNLEPVTFGQPANDNRNLEDHTYAQAVDFENETAVDFDAKTINELLDSSVEASHDEDTRGADIGSMQGYTKDHSTVSVDTVEEASSIECVDEGTIVQEMLNVPVQGHGSIDGPVSVEVRHTDEGSALEPDAENEYDLVANRAKAVPVEGPSDEEDTEPMLGARIDSSREGVVYGETDDEESGVIEDLYQDDAQPMKAETVHKVEKQELATSLGDVAQLANNTGDDKSYHGWTDSTSHAQASEEGKNGLMTFVKLLYDEHGEPYLMRVEKKLNIHE